MSKIFRENYYQCNDNIHKQKINCVNWSVDTESCQTNCSINEFTNPTVGNCISCKKRKSHMQEILEEDAKTNPFTNLTVSAKPEITVKNVVSYAKSESSQFFGGTVDDEIYNERKKHCVDCQYKVNNINKAVDEIGWCTACGCGTGTERTRLSAKLRMPALMCPKGKFGAAIGKGFNIKDAIDSAKGVIKVVSKVL